MKPRRLVLVTVCPAAALASAACASTPDVAAIQDQLSDIQRQVLQLQKQASGGPDTTEREADVGGQVQSLLEADAETQAKLRELADRIEALTANLDDTRQRLSRLAQEIAATNQELKAFRERPPPVVPPSAGADPRRLYDAAYDDYLRGAYDLALRGFQEFLDNFPAADLSDNAIYWMGESYYRQRRFRQAIDQFAAVLDRFGKSDKAPGALLKKGYAHLELGERPLGITALQSLVRRFPTSDEADLARRRLREIGVELR
jgi:tol-pal system protein YbgF